MGNRVDTHFERKRVGMLSSYASLEGEVCSVSLVRSSACSPHFSLTFTYLPNNCAPYTADEKSHAVIGDKRQNGFSEGVVEGRAGQWPHVA